MYVEIELVREGRIDYGINNPRMSEDIKDVVYKRTLDYTSIGILIKSGIYNAIWKPYLVEEQPCTAISGLDRVSVHQGRKVTVYAVELIEYLREGRYSLYQNMPSWSEDKEGYDEYEQIIKFVENYLQGCVDNPNTYVRVNHF